MRPPRAQDQKTTTTIRLTITELKEIRRRSKALGLTLTDYMLRKSLGEPAGDEDYENTLADHEDRLVRLERQLFG